MPYNRKNAIDYAHKWAYGRNPAYADFEEMGGDCTNFMSQCLYAGCGVMNYKPLYGWYYISIRDRTPSWTGVPFLYDFLIGNKGPGPYGADAPLEGLLPGDIIQLSFDGETFVHSVFIVDTGKEPAPENILIATHTFDSDYRPFSTYVYQKRRCVHILGARP